MISAVLYTALEWIDSIKPTDDWLQKRPVVTAIIEKIQNIDIFIVLAVLLVLLVAMILRRMSDPWVVEKLKFILDEYQVKAFNHESESNPSPMGHHKVTLFKHKRNCVFARDWTSISRFWPPGEKKILSDYLVPMLRSGHTAQKTKTIFYAPDDSDKAEGVAGRAWACRKAIVVTNLPILNKDSNAKNVKEYARKTFCDESMVRQRIKDGQSLAAAIVAIPVERSGSLWGVVVLDSRYPDGLSESVVQNYQLTVALIGNLLEKIR